jgi:3-methyl-2-oxobutanoate hydroxymethyltransferase
MDEARVTVPALARAKARGDKIAMLTAYDFAFARIFDAAGIDVLLVGDSLGNVVQGNDTTVPVTLDEMVYHTRLVSRAARWWSATCPSARTTRASSRPSPAPSV